MHDPLALRDVRRTTVAFDLVLAAIFGLLVAPAEWANSSTIAGIATALIACAIAIRHLLPSLMMVLALGTAILQVAATDVAVGGSIGYAPLFAVAGGHPDRRVRRGSLWAAVVGSVVAGIVLPYSFPDGNYWWAGHVLGAAGSLVVCAGGWVWGFTRWQRRSVEQAKVTETITELERRRLVDLYDEQAERSRLARDMHDVVAHSLAVVIAQAEGARFALKTSPESTDEALGVIADTARSALGDVRGVLEQLRSDDTPAQADAQDREQLYARMRAAGMDIRSDETGDPETVDPGAARVAHRVLTETLTNALKHGDRNRPVLVTHDWHDGVRLTVRNSIADDPLSAGGASHGIVGMTERASAAGGTLTSTADGHDWQTVLVIPKPAATPEPEEESS